jgi:hypothetical protein
MTASPRRAWIASLAFAALCAPASLAQSGGSVRVTAARANVRSEPNEKGAVVSQVTSGTVLQLKAVEGDWYRVELQVGAMRVDAYISKKVAAPLPVPGAPAGARSGAAAASPTTPPAPAVPTTKDGMLVAIVAGGASAWLAPGVANVVRLTERVDSLRAAAVAMPIGPAGSPPTGSGPITYVWTIDQRVPFRAITATGASFAVTFKDVPGVSPDDFAPALVRVAGTASGVKVIAAVRGRADAATRAQLEWDIAKDFKYDLVRSSVELVERGVARVQPSDALAPGDYAIVLRPTGPKKFAGASVLSEAAEGRVLNTVWAFSIK